jgi:hypothetical protein
MTLGAIVSRLLEPNICGYFAVMALQPIMLGTQKKWPASFSDGPSFWLLFCRPQGCRTTMYQPYNQIVI